MESIEFHEEDIDLLQHLLDALETLQKISKDTSLSAHDRISACSSILSFCKDMKGMQLGSIEADRRFNFESGQACD